MRFNAGRFNNGAFNSDRLLVLGGYAYRKKHIVSNGGSELTGYQIQVTVHRSTGSDSGGDVYIGSSGCHDDYDDIRVTSADGYTVLSHWIEESDSASATIWVKIPVLAGSGNTTIYLYYRNSSASAGSDGDATFDLFDDFNDGSIDSDKWDIGYNASESGGIVTVGSGFTEEDAIYSKTSFAVGDYIFRGRIAVNSLSLFSYFGLTDYPTFLDFALFATNYPTPNQFNIATMNDGSITSSDIGTGAGTSYHVWEIHPISSSSVKFYVDGALQGEITTNCPTADLRAQITGYDGDAYAYGDYLLVRKLVATEPTHGTWGSEEVFQFLLMGGISTASAISGETDLQQGLSGIISTACGMSGYLFGTTVALTGTMNTMVALSAMLDRQPGLFGTISTATSLPGAHLKFFLSVNNEQIIHFDSGSSSISIGEIITGGTSGATGTVISVVVESGSWGEGDAVGTIIIEDVTGEFIDDEDLDGSTAGDDAATTDGTPTYAGPKIMKVSVSKGIDDIYWTALFTCRGAYSKTEVANFREVEVLMKDHTDTDQQVFLGIAPDFGVRLNPANNTTTIKALSHMWYLEKRQLPDDYLSNAAWDGSKVTYLEPSVFWTALFGGAIWQNVTGIYPQHIIPVSDWGYPRPVKGWAWNKSVKRWDAAIETCIYLDYVIDTLMDGGTVPKAVMCPLDSIDTYLTPTAVTFEDDTYIISIHKDVTDSEKPSLVTVTGARNKRKLNVVSASGTFSESETVTDGGTGAEATIYSVSITGGEGYIIISYDRTGSFCDGDTVINGLGASAVMDGNDEPYLLYDYYTYSYPETEPYRPVEHFESLDEEFDSTPLIEDQCKAIYDFMQLDTNTYSVIFNKRTDLRLWQKVKVTNHLDVIPNEWMRIVWISYERGPATRTVSCTLKNAEYIETKQKMRLQAKYSDEAALQKAVEKYLDKALRVDDAEVLLVNGEYYDVYLVNGEIVKRAKGTAE